MTLQVDERELTSTPTLLPSSRKYGGRFVYYRQPNGHIAPGEWHEAERMRYIAGGWVPLQKYGVFIWNEWAANRPLDHLFLRGGAKELPYEQLMEEGWAYRENYTARPCSQQIDGRPCCTQDAVRVHFPQLDTRPVPPLEECAYCERKGTKEQIQNHLDVMHNKDMAPMAMAKELAKTFRPKDTVEVAAASTMPYVCGKCGEGFNGHMPLAKHVKGHRNA